MAGFFSDKDDERCPHYAQFASHLPRWQFDIIYWILFGFNLLVLFCASWVYMGSQEAVKKYPSKSPELRHYLMRCIFFCIGCVLISTAAVVMEVYTLLALQFCDGEDLMALYWSTWTMIQVGSLIAVIGIILALCHTIRDKRNPPWALALGTPVLVVAGAFHFLHESLRRRMAPGKNSERKIDNQSESPLSRQPTLEACSNDTPVLGAEIVGFALDGGPIIHFTQGLPVTLPSRAEVLGHCQQDKPIVVCQRDAVQLIYEKSSGEASDDKEE